MRWPVDVQRARPGQIRQKEWVRSSPAIANRRCAQHLEMGSLTLRQQRYWQSRWRQVFILRDILKPISEIFRGERLSVRPFMSFAQVERKDPVIFDFDRLEDIGRKF